MESTQPSPSSSSGAKRRGSTEPEAVEQLKMPKILIVSGGAVAPVDPKLEEEFRCPICTDPFLGEILQCGNGHTICKSCQDKTGKDTCAQCRGQMRAREGQLIRNRALERILDQMLIPCPFHKRGCTAYLPRGIIREHMEDCDYGDDVVRICHLLFWGACDFQINRNHPAAALRHFGPCGIHSPPTLEISSYLGTVIVHLEEFQDKANYPIAVTSSPIELYFLLILSVDRSSDSVTFLGLDLNKPTPGQQLRTELTVRIEYFGFDDEEEWEIKVPLIPFSEAGSKGILDKCQALRVDWSRVKKNYTTASGKTVFNVV